MDFLVVLGLAGLAIASVFDLKTREIPDWLSYGLIASGLSARLIYSVLSDNFFFFVVGLIAGSVLFLAGMGMYYAKQWGGGDTKLLCALGILFVGSSWNNNFLVGFLFNLFLVGGLYGLICGIFLAIKNKNSFLAEFRKQFRERLGIRLTGLGITGGFTAMLFFIDSFLFKLLFVSIAVIALFYPYLYIFMKSVENSSMLKKINVSRLTEGDWIKEEVRVKGKLIIGPKCPGIQMKHIEALKKHGIKEVVIKEGIAFAPSFFIAGILTFIFGNLLFSLL